MSRMALSFVFRENNVFLYGRGDNNVVINKFAAHVIHTDCRYCTRNKYWGFNSGNLVWRCDRMHIYYCLDY